MWSHEIQGGTTVYLDAAKKFSAATTAYVEMHSNKKDQDLKVGNLLTLEGGAAYNVSRIGGAFGVGYYLQAKLSDDSGADVPVSALQALNLYGKNRLFGSGRVITQPNDRVDVLNASRAYTRLVEAAFLSGDQWLAVYSAFHALNLAEKTSESPELAEAYGPVGVIYGSIPLRGEASRYLGKAVDTARSVDSPSALGYTLLTRATYSVGAAEWGTAATMASALAPVRPTQRLTAHSASPAAPTASSTPSSSTRR
jgi:hypothetical protein